MASSRLRTLLALEIVVATSRPTRLAADVRILIRQMHAANPLWGAPRVDGELRKLGIHIAQSTVAKHLRNRGTPPSETWRTFLRNHGSQLASVDFFTVPTVTCRTLFVFVVLSHDRRRLVHFNVTAHPTAPWKTAPRGVAMGHGTAVPPPGPRWHLKNFLELLEWVCFLVERTSAACTPPLQCGLQRLYVCGRLQNVSTTGVDSGELVRTRACSPPSSNSSGIKPLAPELARHQ